MKKLINNLFMIILGSILAFLFSETAIFLTMKKSTFKKVANEFIG